MYFIHYFLTQAALLTWPGPPASDAARPEPQPQPLPPPLPPEERSVGQLVAETIRFYQHHFFQTLPLGPLGRGADAADRRVRPSPEVEPRVTLRHGTSTKPTSILGGGVETTILVGAILLTASYIVAIVLVTGKPSRSDGRW